MATENDSSPPPHSAEVFGLRKGIRMAIGTAMDRIKAMPSAAETLHREGDAGVALPVPTFEQVMEIAGKHDTEKNAGLMAFARELLSTYGVKEVPRG
jgi:hypothetical protein